MNPRCVTRIVDGLCIAAVLTCLARVASLPVVMLTVVLAVVVGVVVSAGIQAHTLKSRDKKEHRHG